MTKTKKLNKIIPAVLLSGAMVISTSHLISPTVANALESNNANTVGASTLSFEFHSNGDHEQPLYVLEKGHYTDEVNITSNGNTVTDDIIIGGSNRVSDLEIDITKDKTVAKSNDKLKVKFFLNGDNDQPIYFKNAAGRHVNEVIVGDQEQDVFISGLSDASNLEIQVSECN